MKKDRFITLIVVIVFLWFVYSYYKHDKNRGQDLKEQYINTCFDALSKLELSKEQKLNTCSCRHYYLYSHYGEEIYKDDFVIPTHGDSLKVIECLLENSHLNIKSEELLELLDQRKRE